MIVRNGIVDHEVQLHFEQQIYRSFRFFEIDGGSADDFAAPEVQHTGAGRKEDIVDGKGIVDGLEEGMERSACGDDPQVARGFQVPQAVQIPFSNVFCAGTQGAVEVSYDDPPVRTTLGFFEIRQCLNHFRPSYSFRSVWSSRNRGNKACFLIYSRR